MAKRKKIIITCGVILGIIFIIFLWNYYFARKGNWIIYTNSDYINGELVGFRKATDIVYYGPDIDNYHYEESEESYVNDGTNGIICIYTLHSRFDEYTGSDKQLHIIGNISEIYNENSKTYLDQYGNEIDKFYYRNSFDYDY